MTNEKRAAALRLADELDAGFTDVCGEVSDLLRALAAEPVAEPVAWQWVDTAHFRKKIPADANPGDWRPLYAAPPQDTALREAAQAVVDAWDCGGISEAVIERLRAALEAK